MIGLAMEASWYRSLSASSACSREERWAYAEMKGLGAAFGGCDSGFCAGGLEKRPIEKSEGSSREKRQRRLF